MRHSLVAMVLAAILAAGMPVASRAQMPQAGTTATGPARSGEVADAPVPAVMPSIPSNGAPSSVPDRIAASPGAAAGPANATPFSAAPSSLLPKSGIGSTTLGPIGADGAVNPLPSLAR